MAITVTSWSFTRHLYVNSPQASNTTEMSSGWRILKGKREKERRREGERGMER